jgi:valyl-tRNA synthetase
MQFGLFILETIMGDMAIAVNPEDTRYSKYIGRSVIHPIRHDKLPIIADSTVNQEFGTGKFRYN